MLPFHPVSRSPGPGRTGRWRLLQRPLAAAGLALWSLGSAAQELSTSGFGTLGFARSNQHYGYQRYLDSDGTFKRDSRLGFQADLKLSTQWSATLQLELAPSLSNDARWDLVPSWALVSWRPSDDWLLRAGRARAPLYLHSESMDVGVTHDMARLPTELYSLAPTTDVDGLYLTHTWPSAARPDREVSLDAYSGQRDTTARFWRRDGLPPAVAAGAAFIDVNVRLSGLALTMRQSDLLLRTSMHRVRTRQLDGTSIPVTFPYVELMPGLGYYQVSNALPGPGLQTVRTIGNTIYSLGAEVQLNPQWRASGEYVRNRQDDTEFASDTTSWQLALFHPMGRLTPYASLARLTSRRSALDWYDRLTKAPLPATLPGAGQINAAQRLAAESIWVADQRSLALGASYALSPGLKLKGEWMRTHIGRVSRLVDTPPGSESPHDTSIDVLTVNLNFTF